MKSLTILVAAAAFVTCSASIAKADDAFEPLSVTVQYADLDTNNTQGAAVLYRRLRSAAATVCRGLESSKQLSQVWGYTDCMRKAMSAAVVKVDRPAVTAYAAAHGTPTVEPTVRIAANK
jgi:UrcA family protein